jgi:hypothetical protein
MARTYALRYTILQEAQQHPLASGRSPHFKPTTFVPTFNIKMNANPVMFGNMDSDLVEFWQPQRVAICTS